MLEEWKVENTEAFVRGHICAMGGPDAFDSYPVVHVVLEDRWEFRFPVDDYDRAKVRVELLDLFKWCEGAHLSWWFEDERRKPPRRSERLSITRSKGGTNDQGDEF